MATPLFHIAVLIVAAALAASPARAQWGSIFGSNDPPRPPGSVPQPGPRGGLPPGPPPGPPGSQPSIGGPRDGIQSQPLPPPPGARNAPLDTRSPTPPSQTVAVPPAGQQQPGEPPLRNTPLANP